jgi:predicted nucleic acid-binding protein
VTGIKVVDASALAALLFAEPEAAAIAERLEGARLAAPALLDFELANVCLTKIRRQPTQREALRAAFRLAYRLRVETVTVDHAATLDLAEALKSGIRDEPLLTCSSAVANAVARHVTPLLAQTI